MKSQNPIFSHITLHLLEKCKTLKTFKQIHSHMITCGLALHTYPLSRLLLACSKLSSTYALYLFDQIPNPTIFLYNTLISAFSNQKESTQIALSLYNRVLNHKTLKPNSFTYPSLLKSFGSFPWPNHGQALHAHILKFLGPDYDNFVQASLLNFYAKRGKLGVSRYLFNQISKPDLATWNTMLAACTRKGNDGSTGAACTEDAGASLEALHLFVDMQRSQIKPNEVTLVALIGACANLGALCQGAWVHAYVMSHNLQLNEFVGTALIEMYSRCGCLDLAYQVFDKLSQRDTSCYNAMIGGFAAHGCGLRALELYDNMRAEGLVPDDATFVVTMCACSHVGLVEEGCRIFESIRNVYGLEPKIEHYGCMADLLGRAGRLKEAMEKVMMMPMKPNAVLWRSLLGAARVHGDLEMGEIALSHLIELEPETSGNYVLLSNIYASIDRWEDANKVRKLMKSNGIDKTPGSSLVEVDGVVHEFLTGDQTHPLTKEIYMKLEEMKKGLQKYGHKPSTKDVLFDIEEEEKEDALSCHSERLAIAFALIAYNPDLPIRIIKNLRVCGDCHESTKLISHIYKREVIVRDRSRFHHFKDGICSCLDYW